MPVSHLTDVVVSRLKTPGIYYDETTPAPSLAHARREAKKRLQM
ncbi:MAG: hypothetical protein QOJ96_817 [Alphaproteobacteria bacterium]|jgi:hypothetical protein|nr:hypothetical protein [Alphaproteobacteria bacterium]